ncbi:FimB/Mfa2 family fimbrial subunit [Dysgonomonas sp. Marseille-P4677]|uniref:FimB/Mfa2 family fimbrial subunit n=1 Tax=Dysgonomonas sp. Marseille-P4677 TaxID=2364790 RepID=UPI001912227F|nr:FimB/Mfa2 family fimbrial subunit [Dysgonomonas sp. Marseille-P4677]MBK5719721.1 FimB/Mfa2 family fimbrial subunit [Dysgonomonas sp. Marseille-P4677]
MNKNISISLFSDNVILSIKAFSVFVICILLLLFSACDSDKIADVDMDEPSESNVTMVFKAGTNSLFMENTSIYVFTNTDKFVEKKLNVNVTDNKLSTYMPVGTWNLALLTCDESLAGKIILPPYAGASSCPMWKTGFTDHTEEFLSQAPAELRYDSLLNTVITENMQTRKQATLNRNVAKIQVILKKYTGFDEIDLGKNDFAFVDLLEVPTTLNWRGEYYPNKTNPDNSGNKPIREYFNFKSKLVGGVEELVADTIDYIIPAHRGSDAFATHHIDTTTHKLKLQISMPLKGTSYFGKTRTPIEISYVPKINRIIQLTVTFRGEPDTYLDVKVGVKDWEDPIKQEVEFE